MNESAINSANPSVLEEATRLLNDAELTEAEAVLREHLRYSQGDVEALHLLATLKARQGYLDEAERLYCEELCHDPSRGLAHFDLAVLQIRQGRFDEAATHFEEALALLPDDAALVNDLAVIHHSLGELQKSKQFLERALMINPAYEEAFLNLFEVLWRDGKYSEALFHAQNFLNALAAGNKPGKFADSGKTTAVSDGRTFSGHSLVLPRKPPRLYRLDENEKVALFEKHVPASLRPFKTGLNIAVVADFNIAGQLTLLFRLLNEKTIHRARCIIVNDDFLDYDRDIVLGDGQKESLDEAMKIIENADFFHVGRFPGKIGDVELAGYLKPDNALVQYFGSDIRGQVRQIFEWHHATGIVGLSAWDYTMLGRWPLFYHVNMMFDWTKVNPVPAPEGTIRIIHPTTNRQIKKTELFLETIDRLRREGFDIEPVLVEGKNNRECLELKSQCHLTYDQLSVGIYGVSAIESMAMGHVVFGGISNFAASYFPDNPVVWVTPDDMAEKIKHYLLHKGKITERGKQGIEWVKRHHDPMRILRQHLYLYDFVKNGHRLLTQPDEQLLGEL